MSRERSQKPPYVYRLVRDASGQSETIGIILLLGVTVVGTVAIVAFGSSALTEIESAATAQRTEHTMTLLDSRSAMVALGDSERQSVTFGSSQQGTFTVKEDAGWIRIKHLNFSGDEAGNEVIYNRTLGAFVYERGETTIAYQGGGVWRIEGDGEAQVVSQPELHYRGSTLTLPIIRIQGDGTSVGRTGVSVESLGESRRVFPNLTLDSPGGPAPFNNETGAPYNNSTSGCCGSAKDAKQYVNPIENGNVTITIGSEYYEAWAAYFRERTTAEVTVHDANETVHVRLKTIGDPGFFGTLAQDINIRGISTRTHSMTNFTMNLTEGKNGGGAFGSMHWSFYTSKGSEKLELHVTTTNSDCNDIQSGSEPILVTVYYENGTGAAGHSQEWRTNVYAGESFIEEVTCGPDDESITVNWTAGVTNPGTQIQYEPITNNSCGSSKWHFSSDMSKCDGQGPGSAPMGQHDVDDWTGHPCCPFQDGEEANISFVINHYMAKVGPNFVLEGTEGPGASNRILEDQSSGRLEFSAKGGTFITYLHISENEVEVEVE